MHSIQQNYLTPTMTEHQVLEEAVRILDKRYTRQGSFISADAAKDYLHIKLGGYEREVFAILLLDSQHQLIEFREMFFGTINNTSVYPREVVKAALTANAASVILAHNHPSGISEPSKADKEITQRLKQALALIDVTVLDHIVVGRTCTSFVEQGLL